MHVTKETALVEILLGFGAQAHASRLARGSEKVLEIDAEPGEAGTIGSAP